MHMGKMKLLKLPFHPLGWLTMTAGVLQSVTVTTHTSPNSGLKVLSRRGVFSTFLELYKEWCCSRHTIPSPVWSTYYGKIHFIVTIILQNSLTCEITAPFRFRKIKPRHMMISVASPSERRSHVSGKQCFSSHWQLLCSIHHPLFPPTGCLKK